MTYATIMVCLASDQSNERCLAIAGQLAGRFDARVIGIAAAEFSPPLYFMAGDQAERLLDHGRNAVRKRLTELEVEFRKAMNGCAKQIEWRSHIEMPIRFIAQEARAADLIVIGQSAGNALTDPFAQASPTDLIMQAGRPLFVVPETANWLDLRSALVAWKDTAEARRAVLDALPMLRQAKDVTVAEIVEVGGTRQAALMRTGDVVSWLLRHGITATALVPEESSEWDPMISLDRVASNVGAGLIVAGAYGHSRFREWILGGVTRDLIVSASRCSLLSR
jgi:nucleotide-binding universal stress UspA family protein